MNRVQFTLVFALVIWAIVLPLRAPAQQKEEFPQPKAAGHYLFAWTGDVEHKGNDF